MNAEQQEQLRDRVESQLTAPPILLGGCGRSGTTLLLSILSAHPQIHAIPCETNVFCPKGYHGFDPDNIQPVEVGLDFYEHFDGFVPGSAFDRWCEKTPRNILFFNEIIAYFNRHVRLIQIIRDGRDVVASKHPVNPEQYWVSVERWVYDVSAGLCWVGHPLVHTIRYEDLIRDNDRVVRGICDFLELPYDEPMRNWHRHAKVRNNAAWDGEVKPLFESSIGKWHQREHAERIEELLTNSDAKRLLRELGYLDR